MHPSGAGGGNAEHVQRLSKLRLDLCYWQEVTGMSAGFVLGRRDFDVDSTGLSLSTVAHHHGSGSVTRTSHDPPDVKFLCFGAVARDFSGRQRSPGPDVSHIMLRAAKQD